MTTGQRLGRYEVARELGKGAMGVVYEAVDPAIGRKVALKTILPQPGISEEEQEMRRERFQREAKAAGVLSHPNIVTIYDVGEDRYSGATFFAMEFIDGEDLSKVLKQRGALPAEEVVSIIAQVADALDYAHRGGIVHRDIKPANIVLMPDGRVKVTDFGIAKLESSTLTQTGAYLGTPTFMAPEMISGRAVDGRSDLFSLGVVAYQLLSGAKPFTGDNLATLSYQIMNKDPVPLRTHRPDLPPEAERVFLKCLAKRADERFPNCSAFVSELKLALLPAEERTLDYDERTRAAGPGTGRVRTAAGPGSGRFATAAPSAAELEEMTRAAATPFDATRPTAPRTLETSQATLTAAPSGSGVLIGALAGVALFLGVAVIGLLAYFLVIRKGDVAVVRTPATPTEVATPSTPPPTVSETPATPSPVEPSPTEVATPTLPTPDPAEEERKRLQEERWKRAVAAYSKGQYDAAVKELTVIVQEDSTHTAALDLLEKARQARADEQARREADEQARREAAAREAASRTPAPPPATKVAEATPPPPIKEPDEPSGGAGEGSTLRIAFEHRLAKGTITVWVDGKQVLADSFSGSDEAVVKFKPLNFSLGKESSYSKDVPLSPGSHDVKVSISGKGVDTTASIGGKFKEGKVTQLNVGLGAVDRDIELEWD